jgi:excinuclease ABC subunit B
MAFERGTFRRRGDTIEIFPAHYEDRAWRVTMFGDEVEAIASSTPLTGKKTSDLETIKVYANSHHVTPRPTLRQAIIAIRAELKERLAWMIENGKLLEAQRLEQRTTFDLEMIETTGSCAGIENYSRYLSGRQPGEPPPTFFEYIPDNALLFTDESHQTVPQIGAMYKGDRNRKWTLAEYGFRLPSALDNRPLKFEEWDAMRPQTVHVSATPASWEMERAGGVFAEQVIRPTGLIDPPVEVRPVSKDNASQVDDVVDEIRQTKAEGLPHPGHRPDQEDGRGPDRIPERAGHRVRYMHSDVDTLERIEIIRDLRLGISTCWSASTCCARAWTSPSAASWPFSTPTRKASCARRPA